MYTGLCVNQSTIYMAGEYLKRSKDYLYVLIKIVLSALPPVLLQCPCRSCPTALALHRWENVMNNLSLFDQEEKPLIVTGGR